MTGASASQKDYKTVIPWDVFALWVDRLGEQYTLTGPVGGGVTSRFEDISRFAQMDLDYQSTMLPPGKRYLLEPVEEILSFDISGESNIPGNNRGAGGKQQKISVNLPGLPAGRRALIGIHPCDVNAILYLDKVFLRGPYIDPFYRARRENTFIIALNCKSVTDLCFCHLLGAGPYLKARAGYDMLLTDMGRGKGFLVELVSEKARELFDIFSSGRPPEEKDLSVMREDEAALLKGFKKNLDMAGLQNALLSRPDHHALTETADSRCLSCSNCVMVCPTCFCHNIREETGLPLSPGKKFRIKKIRRWDACQDISFAKVHGGNFRAKRHARLRQFVFHKLDYEGQFGTKGTVGCGRCIRWCPTGIDLTGIAMAMME